MGYEKKYLSEFKPIIAGGEVSANVTDVDSFIAVINSERLEMPYANQTKKADTAKFFESACPYLNNLLKYTHGAKLSKTQIDTPFELPILLSNNVALKSIAGVISYFCVDSTPKSQRTSSNRPKSAPVKRKKDSSSGHNMRNSQTHKGGDLSSGGLASPPRPKTASRVRIPLPPIDPPSSAEANRDGDVSAPRLTSPSKLDPLRLPSREMATPSSKDRGKEGNPTPLASPVGRLNPVRTSLERAAQPSPLHRNSADSSNGGRHRHVLEGVASSPPPGPNLRAHIDALQRGIVTQAAQEHVKEFIEAVRVDKSKLFRVDLSILKDVFGIQGGDTINRIAENSMSAFRYASGLTEDDQPILFERKIGKKYGNNFFFAKKIKADASDADKKAYNEARFRLYNTLEIPDPKGGRPQGLPPLS